MMVLKSPSCDPYVRLGRIDKPNDKSVFVSCDLDFTKMENGNDQVKSFYMVANTRKTTMHFEIDEEFIKSILEYMRELKVNGYHIQNEAE